MNDSSDDDDKSTKPQTSPKHGESNNNQTFAKKSSSFEFDFENSVNKVNPKQPVATTSESNKVSSGKPNNILDVRDSTETGKTLKHQTIKALEQDTTSTQPKLQNTAEKPLPAQSGTNNKLVTNKKTVSMGKVGQITSKATTAAKQSEDDSDKGIKKKPSPFDFDYSQKDQDSASEFDSEDDDDLFGDGGDVDDILDGLGY